MAECKPIRLLHHTNLGRNCTVLKREDSASTISRRRASGLPTPAASLIASSA